MKTPVIYSNDYVVFFEYYATKTFIHCDCTKWSKSIKKSLLADLDSLLQIHRKPVFAIHEIDDKKHLKFLNITGFTFLSDFTGADNKPRQLYVRNI